MSSGFRLYRRALSGRRRALLALAGWSVVEGVPVFLSGRLVALAVDDGFAAHRPWTGLGWLALFGVAAVLGAFGSRLVFERLGSVVEPLRDVLVSGIVRGVLSGPPPRRPDGGVVARVTRHVEVVRDVTAGLLVQSRSLIVTLIAAVSGAVGTAGALAWVMVVPIIALGAFALLLPTLARRQREVVLTDEHTAAVSGSVLSAMRDVVACGAGAEARSSISASLCSQVRAVDRLAAASVVRTVVITLGGLIPVALVLILAPPMVASGALTGGAVLGTVVYLGAVMQPALRGLAENTGTAVLRLVVTLQRIAATSADPVPPPPPLTAAPGRSLLVRDLTFRWGAAAEPVVRGLDLDLSPGDHLAVVGPSGIGKSTLANLLVGLLEPERGRVTLGRVPVCRLPPEARAGLLALIPQEAYIFSGTVRANLSLLTPEATDAELLASVDAVGAGPLVRSLGGLDARVGHNGRSLSSGQAQLLALARVHASPAGVVILDEATSHLDHTAEARAEEAFTARDGVLVVIAHRLDSALRAQRILVMDGRTTELGTHEELTARSTLYQDLTRAYNSHCHMPLRPVNS